MKTEIFNTVKEARIRIKELLNTDLPITAHAIYKASNGKWELKYFLNHR